MDRTCWVGDGDGKGARIGFVGEDKNFGGRRTKESVRWVMGGSFVSACLDGSLPDGQGSILTWM